MKSEQERRSEVIHRILDNDLGPEERQSLKDQMVSDPVLAEEFDAMARIVNTVKNGRTSAPAFFTQDVMSKLPEPKKGPVRKMKDFLFKGRVLKWNMATAMAGSVLAVVAVILLFRFNPGAWETGGSGQTVTVTMNLYAPDARRVTVAGSFNKWNTDADLLRKGENGYWTISIPLEPGDYSYMFVVDGKGWVTDPNAASYRDDGFGNKNAVLRVKT